jgi:arylsulfatase A-like enzyme
LEERTLADALRSAGYRTALTGKWHLGEFKTAYQPNARGFDHQYGHFFGMVDYFTHERMGQVDWYRNGAPLTEEGYTTHLITKEACKIIETEDKAKPLFLYVPFNGVHSPFQGPDSYIKPYANLKGNRQKLAGMLAAVDEAIGKVEESLRKAGILENTLINFSSDNGGLPPGDNGALRDFKGTIYEGGVRAAAFACWPGRIPAGQRIREPMHMVDWYPTLIKLGGGSLVVMSSLFAANTAAEQNLLAQAAKHQPKLAALTAQHDEAQRTHATALDALRTQLESAQQVRRFCPLSASFPVCVFLH